VDQSGRGRSLSGAGAAGRAPGMVTAAHFEVSVPTPDDGHVLVDLRERRADVVGRLLDLGVTPRTLMTLLPEWEAMIARVAAQRSP
jgi:hypothetical protein